MENHRYLMPNGPIFAENQYKNGTRLAAVVLSFVSNTNLSLSYSRMNQFQTQLSTFIDAQLAAGPEAVRGGWYASDFVAIYQLQQALLFGAAIVSGCKRSVTESESILN
jgi:hypothetical protein